MAYSRTPKTISKVQSLLDEMVESDIDLEWSVNDAKKTAYHIWQAIKYAIRSGKKEYEEYSKLGKKFKVKIVDGFLRAEIRRDIVVHGTIYRGVTDVIEVLGVAIGMNQKSMIFPDLVDLSESDKKILSNWCKENNYIPGRHPDTNQFQLKKIND